MDVLGAIGHYGLIVLIFVLQGILFLLPFVILYFANRLGQHEKVDTKFGWEIAAGLLLGLVLCFLDTRKMGPLMSFLKKDSPWNIGVGEFWMTRANPLAYPLRSVVEWIIDDIRYNRLVIAAVAPLAGILVLVIKSFKRNAWGILAGVLVYLLAVLVGLYTANFLPFIFNRAINHPLFSGLMFLGLLVVSSFGGAAYRGRAGDRYADD